MTTKLFVGKLSFNTTSDALQASFSEQGTVTNCQVITDRDSNRSRGFAFVEMENEADAQKAIEALNGKSLDDRTIVVSVAQPKDRSNGSRGGFQRR